MNLITKYYAAKVFKAWYFTLLVAVLIGLKNFDARAQELLYHTRIENENRGINLYYTGLFKLFEHTYFTTQTAGYQRLKFGDQFLTGQLSDTLVDFNKNDQFIIKLNPSQEIIDYWVIDNCELYDDHTNTDEYSVILLNVWHEEDADSLAIMTMPDGTQIPRKDHINQSIIVITDSLLNYIEYHVPTTGRIEQIEGGEELLYMGIQLRAGQEFILIGEDTVWNYQSIFGGYYETYVIAAYDLKSKEFLWWNRLGSGWSDWMLDFKIDDQENIYTLIYPGAFENYYADTVVYGAGTGPYYNVLLKIAPNGKYLWSQEFEGVEGEYLGRLYLDHDGNPYLTGQVYGPDIHLFDTTFILGINEHGKGIIIKLDQDGTFNWGVYLTGDYSHNVFSGLDINAQDDVIYLSGGVNEGNIELSGILYSIPPDIDAAYILKVDRFSGMDLGHVLFQGTSISKYYDVIVNEDGSLLTYMRFKGNKNFLGHQLQSLVINPSGFLLTLNTAWDTILSVMEPTLSLFHVYPNPVLSEGEICVDVKEVQGFNLYIIDSEGFIVRGIQKSLNNNLCVDLVGLVPGMYTVLIQSDNKYQSSKFIIQ